jgi:hypothetical protein
VKTIKIYLRAIEIERMIECFTCMGADARRGVEAAPGTRRAGKRLRKRSRDRRSAAADAVVAGGCSTAAS